MLAPAAASTAGVMRGSLARVALRTMSTRPPRFGKVLVTGAVGQIGQELVPHLRALYGDERVVASDVKPPPEALRSGGPFRYVDVLNQNDLARVVVEDDVDTVVHLVAVLSAVGEQNPGAALQINNGGTENVLELARKLGLRVFCPSSIAAFGPSTPKFNPPEDCVLRPITMYGATKVHAELLGEYYHSKFQVDFRSLRYPGVVSYKAQPGGGTTDYAVEIFHEAIAHKRYTCFLQQDCFLPMIYMPDLLKATTMLMEADDDLLTRRTYNLGSMTFSPDTLTEALQQHMPDFEIDYDVDPTRQRIADSWPYDVDDSQARKDWGWQADYDMNRMVEGMLQGLGHDVATPAERRTQPSERTA